jgi:hypothetical protein
MRYLFLVVLAKKGEVRIFRVGLKTIKDSLYSTQGKTILLKQDPNFFRQNFLPSPYLSLLYCNNPIKNLFSWK